MVNLEKKEGQLYYGPAEEVGLTRHRKVWAMVGGVSFFTGALFYIDVIRKLVQIGWIEDTGDGPCGLVLFAITICHNAYVLIFTLVLYLRLTVPYKLRRSEKQFIDSALVVASSCLVACVGWTSSLIQAQIFAFHVIPLLNIWWDYPNFGFWDCVFFGLIEVALFCCRGRHLLVLMAVAGVCIALQQKKNAYQEEKQQLYLYEKIEN